jgi:metal-responsive CopG/Arc/MetJ family transcriptional regulator
MGSNTPVGCRLPDDQLEALDEVADERGEVRATVMRRAVRYYLGDNPDEVSILE